MAISGLSTLRARRVAPTPECPSAREPRTTSTHVHMLRAVRKSTRSAGSAMGVFLQRWQEQHNIMLQHISGHHQTHLALGRAP